ncbi:60S ribosomal export protein NMD3, partial [Trifolium medium]|nr:60S ribosomal export protein NMD3 [Trifolium medium]
METKAYLYYSEAVHLGQKFEKEVMEDPSEEWRAVVEENRGVTRAATTITLLDPLTLRQCYLDANQYWKAPFTPSFTRSQLVEYVVIDIVLEDEEKNGYRLADVEVARAKDFGNNDFTVRMKTHL